MVGDQQPIRLRSSASVPRQSTDHGLRAVQCSKKIIIEIRGVHSRLASEPVIDLFALPERKNIRRFSREAV